MLHQWYLNVCLVQFHLIPLFYEFGMHFCVYFCWGLGSSGPSSPHFIPPPPQELHIGSQSLALTSSLAREAEQQQQQDQHRPQPQQPRKAARRC